MLPRTLRVSSFSNVSSALENVHPDDVFAMLLQYLLASGRFKHAGVKKISISAPMDGRSLVVIFESLLKRHLHLTNLGRYVPSSYYVCNLGLTLLLLVTICLKATVFSRCRSVFPTSGCRSMRTISSPGRDIWSTLLSRQHNTKYQSDHTRAFTSRIDVRPDFAGESITQETRVRSSKLIRGAKGQKNPRQNHPPDDQRS